MVYITVLSIKFTPILQVKMIYLFVHFNEYTRCQIFLNFFTHLDFLFYGFIYLSYLSIHLLCNLKLGVPYLLLIYGPYLVQHIFLLVKKCKCPGLVWLSGLSASLKTKGSLVRFPVRAHAWSPVGAGREAPTH